MKEWKEKIDTKITVKLVIAVLLAVLSFAVLAEKASAPEFYGNTIASLDEKKGDVMGMTATIAASSTAVSMLPGDMASPIADQIMGLSDWLLLALCTVFLEKYLLTIIGFMSFKFIIPAGLLLYVVGLFAKSPVWQSLWRKLIVLGLVFTFSIPAGEKASAIIEETYQLSVELSQEEDALAEIIEAETDEKENLFTQFFEKVKGGAEEKIEEAKNMLNRFIERVAIMVVTSCLIPVAVLLFMFWVGKTIVGIDMAPPERPRIDRCSEKEA